MIKNVKSIRNFWIIFFAVLTALFIATSIYTFVTLSDRIDMLNASTVNEENFYRIGVENTYQQAMYEACETLIGLDASISKAIVSNDTNKQIDYLMGISALATNLNSDVSRLPISQSDVLGYVERYTNQLNNYSKSLVKKLVNGDGLSLTDKTTLAGLNTTSKALYTTFREIMQANSGMYVTNSLFLNGANVISDGMSEMDTNIFKNQSLVYDGPFSDGVEEQKIVTKSTMTAEQGRAMLWKLFDSENINSVNFVNTVNNYGTLYAYDVETDEGTIRVMLSTDGRLVEFAYNRNDEGGLAVYDKTACSQIAEQYANKLGFEVASIWVSAIQEQTTYINLAPIVDGVIVYPDMVKIAVDTHSGDVVGFEARAYILNHHKERDLNFSSNQNDFLGKFSSMGVVSSNKAIVEMNNKEYKCFEYECIMGDGQYFVYIDSTNGAEVEILKVVEDAEGYTVI